MHHHELWTWPFQTHFCHLIFCISRQYNYLVRIKANPHCKGLIYSNKLWIITHLSPTDHSKVRHLRWMKLWKRQMHLHAVPHMTRRCRKCLKIKHRILFSTRPNTWQDHPVFFHLPYRLCWHPAVSGGYICPKSILLDCGWKLEFLERTHTCMGKSCKCHGESPQAVCGHKSRIYACDTNTFCHL